MALLIVNANAAVFYLLVIIILTCNGPAALSEGTSQSPATGVWRNREIEKYKNYFQTLKNAVSPVVDLEDTLQSTNTHIYAIVTKKLVRLNHVDRFLSSLLKLKDHDAITTSHLNKMTNSNSFFTIIPAVEINTDIPLVNYVHSGILSKDYNASWRHQRMNHGRLGCQLSLIQTLEIFLNSSHERALIFEGSNTILYLAIAIMSCHCSCCYSVVA